jgi:hypothetical protein
MLIKIISLKNIKKNLVFKFRDNEKLFYEAIIEIS